MPSSITSTKPLIKRPLDLFYFTYFIFNVITFLLIDGQNFYPSSLVPEALKRIVQDYLKDSGDPFVLALRSHDRQYIWFATSMWSSLVFQNPVYLLAIWGLWKDEKRIYPIMASYGMLGVYIQYFFLVILTLPAHFLCPCFIQPVLLLCNV